MRLRTRLSWFFLGALGLVLLGFSTTLYLLASTYLHRQIDERLDAALNTLTAAAESAPDGVEWDPRERNLTFGRRTIAGPFFWRVGDGRGVRVDGSSTGAMDRLLVASSGGADGGTRPQTVEGPDGEMWRVQHRRLGPPPKVSDDEDRPEEGEGHDGKYPALILSTAVSLEGVRATLRNLGLVLVVLSIVLWALALLCGRWLSGRALRPLSTMAEAAHAIGGDEVQQRLPVPRTADELEELGRSFNALLDRVQESFERQRRFTGDASHQLRTPLTAIQGEVDLALRQPRDTDEYRRVLALIQRKTRHLRQIVESLLFLARADGESFAPRLETVDLECWLRSHIEVWNESRGKGEVGLEIEPDGPLWVKAQPSLLGELLNNLLDNARKYSAPGSPIVVSARRDDQSVRLDVEDQGIGIDDEEIPRLFEPFYRSNDARQRGSKGLGLGLSVALRLARSFGGTIEVESRRGRGSRFTLRLPFYAPMEPPEAVAIAKIDRASQER